MQIEMLEVGDAVVAACGQVCAGEINKRRFFMYERSTFVVSAQG